MKKAYKFLLNRLKRTIQTINNHNRESLKKHVIKIEKISIDNFTVFIHLISILFPS